MKPIDISRTFHDAQHHLQITSRYPESIRLEIAMRVYESMVPQSTDVDFTAGFAIRVADRFVKALEAAEPKE